jgi:urease accessory protein
MWTICNRQLLHVASAVALATLFPGLAQSHAGAGPVHSFADGFSHPLAGLDHLAAMTAVGLWAAQRGARAIWLWPATFVALMALGGSMGMTGRPVPFVEPAIVASVIVIGLIVTAAVPLPTVAGVAIVGAFAVFHGHAHGSEVIPGAAGSAYGAGFVIATAALHLLGIAIGLGARHAYSAQALRYIGGAIAVFGLYLCVA